MSSVCTPMNFQSDVLKTTFLSYKFTSILLGSVGTSLMTHLLLYSPEIKDITLHPKKHPCLCSPNKSSIEGDISTWLHNSVTLFPFLSFQFRWVNYQWDMNEFIIKPRIMSYLSRSTANIKRETEAVGNKRFRHADIHEKIDPKR